LLLNQKAYDLNRQFSHISESEIKFNSPTEVGAEKISFIYNNKISFIYNNKILFKLNLRKEFKDLYLILTFLNNMYKDFFIMKMDLGSSTPNAGNNNHRPVAPIREQLFMPMDISSLLNPIPTTHGGSNNNPPVANHPVPVTNPVPVAPNNNPVGNQPKDTRNNFLPFIKTDGVYRISDPTNIAERGYIDLATGEPYPTYQPFASFLSQAMAHDFEHSTATKKGDIV
jgi:hypothetical protein